MSGCDAAVYANRLCCLGVELTQNGGADEWEPVCGILRCPAETIAEAIDARPGLAPFQLPGAAVISSRSMVRGSSVGDGHAWQSLRRVDAIGCGAAVVFTRIPSVQLVDGVEVLFRRETHGILVIAKGGRIIVRS